MQCDILLDLLNRPLRMPLLENRWHQNLHVAIHANNTFKSVEMLKRNVGATPRTSEPLLTMRRQIWSKYEGNVYTVGCLLGSNVI
jgi:hypothetical protein